MIELPLNLINEKSPYEDSYAPNGDFVFATNLGIHYLISFEAEQPVGGCATFQERFTIRTASAVVEGKGFYAAIIVEKRNPLLENIIADFETTAEALTTGKP